MSRLCVIACLLCVVACGSSPSAPTPVAQPVQAPAAATVVMESFGYLACVSLGPNGQAGCTVSLTMRNQGPDCASQIRGTLHISLAASSELLGDVQFTVPTTVVLRANETFNMSGGPVTLRTTTGTQGRFEAFSTPIRCP